MKLTNPIIPAPMAGYTDSPFRTLLKDFDISLSYTELISAEGIVRNIPKTMKMLKICEKERPLSIQIFGNNSESISNAASIVSELNPETIDLNIGCCAPKVTGSGSGAALLKDPDLLREIAEKTVKLSKVPVSAKIRIGWDNSSLNYREIVTLLQDSGISRIAVHGRTAKQRYTGKSNWDIIGEIAYFAEIPIIGSGDIHSYEEAHDKLQKYNCDAVMIGRAAVGNPWIFSGETPSFEEIISVIKKHINLMLDYYGEYGIILMRKHLVKYIHGFRNASSFRGRLIQAVSPEDVFSILKEMKDTNTE